MPCCSIKQDLLAQRSEINQVNEKGNWVSKAIAISLLALGLISISIGAAMFQTGTWAYVCYGTGGALILADLIFVVLSKCSHKKAIPQATPPVIEEKAVEVLVETQTSATPPAETPPAETPTGASPNSIEKPKENSTQTTPETTSVLSVENAPKQELPKEKTFKEKLEELKNNCFEQIDKLKLPKVPVENQKCYSKQELREDIELTIQMYNLSNTDDQKKVLVRLKALNTILSTHLKELRNFSRPAIVGFKKYLQNNGYINVGLLLLVHTNCLDYLLYRPLRVDSSENKEKEKQLLEAQVLLRNVVTNLRKNIPPTESQITQLFKMTNELNQQLKLEKTPSSFGDLLKVLSFFSPNYLIYGKLASLNDLENSLFFVRSDTESTGLYLKKAGKWYYIQDETIEEFESFDQIVVKENKLNNPQMNIRFHEIIYHIPKAGT